jgi:hypothetical protein
MKSPYPDFITGAIILRETEDKDHQWHLSAGLSYFLSKNISLELLTSYTKDSNVGFFTDYSAVTTQLGLQIYLSK